MILYAIIQNETAVKNGITSTQTNPSLKWVSGVTVPMNGGRHRHRLGNELTPVPARLSEALHSPVIGAVDFPT